MAENIIKEDNNIRQEEIDIEFSVLKHSTEQWEEEGLYHTDGFFAYPLN